MEIISKNNVLKLTRKVDSKKLDDDFISKISQYFIENLKKIIEILLLIVNHRKIASNNWKYDNLINEQNSGAIILEHDVLLALKIMQIETQFKGNYKFLDTEYIEKIKIDFKNIGSVALPKNIFSEILIKIKKLIVNDDNSAIRFSLSAEIIIQYVIEKMIQEYIDLK
jgi:hypothetical protein